MAGIKTIREFVTKWGFNVDDDKIKATESGIKRIRGQALAVGAALTATTFAVGGLVAKVSGYVDELAKGGRDIGLTAQDMGELAFAAELSGIELDRLKDGLKDLTKNTIEASRGAGEAKDTFKRLGINAKELAKLPADEKLEAVADALMRIDDPGERAAARMRILGESGIKMGSLFAQGGEGIRAMRAQARALGVDISENLVADAEALNDAIAGTKLGVKTLGIGIASDLIPTVREVAESVRDWTIENGALIRQRVSAWTKSLVSGLKTAIAIGRRFVDWTRSAVDALGGLERILAVVKFLVATFIARQAILGVQAMISVVQGLIATYRAMGAAALIAQAKTLLIPIAIAAIIALIGLAIEDFHKFFNGQDSAIGELVKKYPELGEAIMGIRDWYAAAIDVTSEFFDFFMQETERGQTGFDDWLFEMVDGFNNWEAEANHAIDTWAAGVVDRFHALIDSARGFWSELTSLGGLIGDESDEEIERRRANIVRVANGIATGRDAIPGARRSAPRAVAPERLGGSGSNVTVEGSTITVVQRPGEDGEALSRRIQREQDQAFAQRARRLSAAIGSPYDY